jgi:hypothetical protein
MLQSALEVVDDVYGRLKRPLNKRAARSGISGISGISRPIPTGEAKSADDERSAYEIPLDLQHEDYGMVEPIVSALLVHAGGWKQFSIDVSRLIRRAVDEVIDTERTNRFTLNETEKTEKTYLGTKIEILFRWSLKLPKGRDLDLSVDGADVDVKNTMQATWSIPEEAVSRPCLLIRENEKTALCSVGVIIAQKKYLNLGRNKDMKGTIAAEHLRSVWWMLHKFPYPPNIWEVLSLAQRETIMEARGGSARVAAMFELLQLRPISRSIVAHVAQQRDPLKRVRRNGGARDHLAPKGIAILFGSGDRELISRFGLPSVANDEFISYTPVDEKERQLLQRARHID